MHRRLWGCYSSLPLSVIGGGLACCMAFSTIDLAAQPSRYIPVEDQAYSYIDRLQRRGYMVDLNPSALPYNVREVRSTLDALDTLAMSSVERRWVRMIDSMVSPPVQQPEGTFIFGSELQVGAIAVNDTRPDPVRPLEDDPQLYQRGIFRFNLSTGNWITQVGIRHDGFYDRDPDGIDTAHRAMIRTEDNYTGYSSRMLEAFISRIDRHWGLVGRGATLVSSNPRSYDHLFLRFGGERLSFRFLMGELDSVTGDGRFTGIAGDDSVTTGSERRFLVSHRLDWRPSRHVHFAVMESVLYSGPNSGPSIKYLVPWMAYGFESDSPPKNDENNAVVAGLLWINVDNFTLFGQFGIDDLDVLGIGDEPASFSLIGSVTLAGVAPAVDVGLDLEAVASRTYNAFQPEGKYIYLLRGLATQFSDYVHTSVYADWYADGLLSGLVLSPRVHLLAQGREDIRNVFPPRGNEVGTILTGTTATTIRVSSRIKYQSDRRWWVGADLGWNRTTNDGGVEGRTRSRFVGLVEVGARIGLARAYSIGI